MADSVANIINYLVKHIPVVVERPLQILRIGYVNSRYILGSIVRVCAKTLDFASAGKYVNHSENEC